MLTKQDTTIQNFTEAQKRFIENRMSRYRLAKTSGLSQKTIWAIWYNRNRASMGTYDKISKALGVSVSEFLSIKD